MKTIQKLTLSLLTIVASSAGFATSMTIQVDGTDIATHSGAISTGTCNKTGAGNLILQGNNSAMSVLSINGGNVEVDTATNAMPVAITFNNAGSTFEVDVASASVPTLTMTTAGILLADFDLPLAGLAGAGALTISGVGAVTPGDLHASTTPMNIGGIVNVGTAGHLLPTSLVTVLSSGLVDIKGVTADCMPGTNVVNSGATLQVDASLTVPAASSTAGAELFGTLKFDSGSTLKLGNGAVWARAITVGTAL